MCSSDLSAESLLTHPLEMVKIVADRVTKVLAKATALEAKLIAMMGALGMGTFDNHVNYSASGAAKPTLPRPGASEQEVELSEDFGRIDAYKGVATMYALAFADEELCDTTWDLARDTYFIDLYLAGNDILLLTEEDEAREG